MLRRVKYKPDLPDRAEISGIDRVEGQSETRPMLGDGCYIVGEIAEGEAVKTAGVGR